MDPNISALGTEITPVNGNYTLTSCDFVYITLIFLINIIALAGLAGNGTVLWLLGFHLRRNAFTVYVLNLAGADFFFLCFQTVYSLDNIINVFHPLPSSIPIFFHFVLTFAYLAGLSILSTISAERCLSVLWPIWYRCRRPRHTSAVMCALLWAFSLLLSLLEGHRCGFLFNYSNYIKCQTLDFISAAWLIVLFVVLSVSSLVLLVRTFCSSRRIPMTGLYVTIALTVVVYLFFGLAFGIQWFLLIWINNVNFEFLCSFHEITVFLSSVNSCANPIIYFLVGSFRCHRFLPHRPYTLKLILQRAVQDIPEEEEGGDTSS